MVKYLILVICVGWMACPPKGLSVAEIDERVQKWQPTTKELAWKRVGWAEDIRDALRRARTTHKPVFLFTHDGRLGIGRC